MNVPGVADERIELMRAAYGGNFDRLVELKAEYDPAGLFRSHPNVTLPAGDADGRGLVDG